jgi:hypothetical protein
MVHVKHHIFDEDSLGPYSHELGNVFGYGGGGAETHLNEF